MSTMQSNAIKNDDIDRSEIRIKTQLKTIELTVNILKILMFQSIKIKCRQEKNLDENKNKWRLNFSYYKGF